LGLNLSRARIGILLFFCGLAACSRPATQTPPDAAALLLKIPAGDAAKFNSSQEVKNWHNPYLIVRTDKVGLLTSTAPNEEQQLKPEEVLDVLAQVPSSAWPYGRVVAVLVEERPNTSDQGKIALRRNRGIVAGELKSAQVEIRWMSGP
jgi:hypothetical protein